MPAPGTTLVSSDIMLSMLGEHHPPAIEVLLGVIHRWNRLEFKRTHIDWRCVLFTDEPRFNRYLTDRCQRLFQRAGGRHIQCWLFYRTSLMMKMCWYISL